MQHGTSAGVTLLELLLVVVLIGLLSTLAGVSLASLRPSATGRVLEALEQARADALAGGQAVTWSDHSVTIRFLPDGSSSGGWVQAEGVRLWVDPLTGGVHAAE